MPDHVVAASVRFPGGGGPAWVLLNELSTIGYHRSNATTATGLTSARRAVQVSFALADPPEVSRCLVHCLGLSRRAFSGSPEILNAADGLVLMRIAFLRGDGQAAATDYFVYRTGPGEPPSLHLIPGPCPEVASPKRVGILPGAGGEHYFVVFPVPQFNKPDTKYEIVVFSSETQSWSSKVARVSEDRETTDNAVATHEPTKAIAAGGSSLAWVDLCRGVLLCNVLDEDPVLRLLQWPVPPPPPRDEHPPRPSSVRTDTHSPLSFRDATLSNGAIRFVESILGDNGGWTVTVSKRETGSKYWYKCFKADIARILAKDSSYSDLLRRVWDDEASKRSVMNKVLGARPILSSSNEDVVYFMTSLASAYSEPLMLAVNVREGRVEAAKQSCVKGTCCPCTFFRCIGADETSDDPSESSAEDSCVAPTRTSLQLGALSFVVEHDEVMEDESIPAAANVMPSNNIFVGVNFRKEKEEDRTSKEHVVQIGSMAIGITM